MKRQIKTILVPVDFSDNTDLAISKALEFCPDLHEDSTIHLVHVQRILSGGFAGFFSHLISGYTQQQFAADTQVYKNRLEELKTIIQKERPTINVVCWVSFGDPIPESIAKKAKQLSADLIIIGKKSHHSLFSFMNTVIPSKLAAATGVPVLTAKPGSLNQEIKTIVIPVSERFPDTKLEMLATFRNGSRPQIRLVIFKEDEASLTAAKQHLLNAFRMIKTTLLNSVNYEVLEGKNKAKALLKYCDKIGADVLIVYPGSETRVGNWPNSHISDLLPSGSKTQILAIRPG